MTVFVIILKLKIQNAISNFADSLTFMIVVVEDWKMRCDATTKSVWTLYTWLPHH
jgi:hypothetical protein